MKVLTMEGIIMKIYLFSFLSCFVYTLFSIIQKQSSCLYVGYKAIVCLNMLVSWLCTTNTCEKIKCCSVLFCYVQYLMLLCSVLLCSVSNVVLFCNVQYQMLLCSVLFSIKCWSVLFCSVTNVALFCSVQYQMLLCSGLFCSVQHQFLYSKSLKKLFSLELPILRQSLGPTVTPTCFRAEYNRLLTV